MARPIDSEKRVELCLKAVEFLRENGLETSTARLATALGIKRPTLLYYFPDRVAIFEQAMADLLAEQVNFVVARMMQHDHPIDQLFAQVRAVHAFHHEREDRVLFLTQALAVAGKERTANIVRIGNAAFEAHRQALGKRIRDGIERGIIHECDPDALVRICRATIDGLMVQRVMFQCDLEPVHELLWSGLLEPLKRDPTDPNGNPEASRFKS
jgi:AcrR family transcriptional regulator